MVPVIRGGVIGKEQVILYWKLADMHISKDKSKRIGGDLIAGKRVVAFIRSQDEAKHLMKEVISFLSIDPEIEIKASYSQMTIRSKSRDHEGVAFFRKVDRVRGLSADSVYLDDGAMYELWFKGISESVNRK